MTRDDDVTERRRRAQRRRFALPLPSAARDQVTKGESRENTLARTCLANCGAGPPPLRQVSCLSCADGASIRTSLYSVSQFGRRNIPRHSGRPIAPCSKCSSCVPMLGMAGGNLPRPTWGAERGRRFSVAANLVSRTGTLADFQKSDSDFEVCDVNQRQ